MNAYVDQVRALDTAVDAGFWQAPQGVAIAGDDLKFLYIPDHVEAFIVAELARKVYAFQEETVATGEQITKAVMITMGGLLPGVLLHDHLAWNPARHLPTVEFGTFGVQYYEGPGQALDAPRIIQDVTLEVAGQVVGIVEDLVDLGGTARFAARYLLERGAKSTVLIAPYLKSASVLDDLQVIAFGVVPQDTWIITPRERVETLIKRVPYWRERGASMLDCHANLAAIGYPAYLIDLYLSLAYAAE